MLLENTALRQPTYVIKFTGIWIYLFSYPEEKKMLLAYSLQ